MAFTVLAYFTFFAGVLMFSIGLYNADNLQLNEKGYYIAVMILVAVGAILTQKVTRDNAEDNEIIAEQEQERLNNLKNGAVMPAIETVRLRRDGTIVEVSSDGNALNESFSTTFTYSGSKLTGGKYTDIKNYSKY